MIRTSRSDSGVTDCLVVGHHELPFTAEVQALAAMGKNSGAYRDLRLAFVEVDGRPYRALDLLNHYRGETGIREPRLHNLDFLWPAVASLVTFLRRQGLEADYVNLPHLERAAFAEKLQRAPRVVAITTTLHVAAAPILDLVPFIREHAPRTTLVVGGPFIYNQTRALDQKGLEDLFGYIGADVYVVSRAGEGALAAIARAVRDGGALDGIANIVYRRSQSLPAAPAEAAARGAAAVRLRVWAQDNPDRVAEISQKLRARASARSADTPQRSAFTATSTLEENHNLEDNRIDYAAFPPPAVGHFVSLWTSKSCPFACSFCGFPERGGEYRYLAVRDLAGEFEKLADLGVKNLTFIDDTLNVPKGRFKEMLKLLIQKGYGFRWNCFYRADHGDQETVALMREAGCAAVFLGVESGSDRILGLMNKTSRRAHYLRAIPLMREAGILTHANFIVGFPGETADSVAESMDLIDRAAPDTFRAQLWYADPVTPIWRVKDDHGLTGQAFNWRHATMDCHEAADWVDEMFMRVKSSVWLPQQSFEQWSILYLQYNGMARESVFAYMRHFNELIRDRLRSGEQVAPDRERLKSLQELACFTRPQRSLLPASFSASTPEATRV